jgi:hypothetical protein
MVIGLDGCTADEWRGILSVGILMPVQDKKGREGGRQGGFAYIQHIEHMNEKRDKTIVIFLTQITERQRTKIFIPGAL